MDSMPASKVLTQSSVKGRPGISESRSRVMTKSSSSSSTSNTLTRPVSIIEFSLRGGQFDGVEPVLAEEAHDVDEGLELDRLGDKRVGAQIVHATDVRAGRCRSEER